MEIEPHFVLKTVKYYFTRGINKENTTIYTTSTMLCILKGVPDIAADHPIEQKAKSWHSINLYRIYLRRI